MIADRILVPCENTHGPECSQNMATDDDERERMCDSVQDGNHSLESGIP